MNLKDNLPYLECSQIVSKIALTLSRAGDAHFIPFICEDELTSSEFDKQAFWKNINDFDFVLGKETGNYILSILILNKIYLDLEELSNAVKHEIQRKLRLLINTIDSDPPQSKKLAYRLLMMKTDLDKDSKEMLLSLNNYLKNMNENLTSNNQVCKELFYFPLKYLEEYNIRRLFFELTIYLESVIFPYINEEEDFEENRILIYEIFLLKKFVLDSNMDKIYHKFLNIIYNVLSVIEKNKNSTYKKFVHSEEHENKIYIKRMLIQLIKLGESVSEVKKLDVKLNKLVEDENVKISSLLDDEIHGLVESISKQNITSARLELRLNDDWYPLSVTYRKYIKNLL